MLGDEIGEGLHGFEGLQARGLVLDFHAEHLLDAQYQLQGIDGIQAQAIPEEGGQVVDLVGGHALELQPFDDHLFDAQLEVAHGFPGKRVEDSLDPSRRRRWLEILPRRWPAGFL